MAATCQQGKCVDIGEKVWVECDEQLFEMLTICSQLRDWMVEVNRSDQPAPVIICEDGDCAGAIAAGTRNEGPFTSVTSHSDVFCGGDEEPKVCEVSCYGWQD